MANKRSLTIVTFVCIGILTIAVTIFTIFANISQLALYSPLALSSTHHASKPSKVNQATTGKTGLLPNVYQTSNCLYAIVLADHTDSNALYTNLGEGNGCSMQNSAAGTQNIPPDQLNAGLYYRIHTTCPAGLGAPDRYGYIPYISLTPNQRVSTTAEASSYCVNCTDGLISGFPPFTITLSILRIDGVYGMINGQIRYDIPMGLSPDSPQTNASGKVANNANDPGPLRCSA